MVAATVSMGGIGFVAGVILAIASKIFDVPVDPIEQELIEALPGMNCGACGYSGCAAYAKAIAAGDVALDRCVAGGLGSREVICRIMGEPFEERQAEVAMVLCQGDHTKAKAKYRYFGIADCRAAQMIADGPKECPSGCLGFGTCARICPIDAIEISPLGLARINRDKCIGCGRCVTVCPRSVIRLVPRDASVHVLCNSHDRGRVVRSYCQIGCISCHICERTVPQAYRVEDNLARVVYEHDDQAILAVHSCPTGCIRAICEKDLSGKGFVNPLVRDERIEAG